MIERSLGDIFLSAQISPYSLLCHCLGECLRVLTLVQSTEWEGHPGDHANLCAAQTPPVRVLTVRSVDPTDGPSACHVCGQDLI